MPMRSPLASQVRVHYSAIARYPFCTRDRPEWMGRRHGGRVAVRERTDKRLFGGWFRGSVGSRAPAVVFMPISGLVFPAWYRFLRPFYLRSTSSLPPVYLRSTCSIPIRQPHDHPVIDSGKTFVRVKKRAKDVAPGGEVDCTGLNADLGRLGIERVIEE